jgi:predicted NAD/FAD-binding protein
MNNSSSSLKVAVVGSGISGLSAAYRLEQAGNKVTLFESADYFGGHTHTVDVALGGISYGVDTGFLVFNHKTYPNLVKLFDELNIETVATDMSFSVKSYLPKRILEWSGGSLNSVFAQRRNLFNPRFIRMLRDILRFNEETTLLALTPHHAEFEKTLGQYLINHDYSAEFRDWYLLPMAGCIWSCPTAQMLAFPLSTFVHFCHNHGLLQVNGRPQWHTVKGGARHYVDKMLAGLADKRLNKPVQSITRNLTDNKIKIKINTQNGSEIFDHVVLAVHSDQALRMLRDATPAEQKLLGAIAYQPNRAVLHTDDSCLPRNKKTWSAWNYESKNGNEPQVCVHYLINKLQPLPFKESVIVSLNPISEPHPDKIISTFDYAHPVFDSGAISAQQKIDQLQGRQNTWFAGAWTGYGFHEDGLKSGLAVAKSINALESRDA